VGNDGTTEYKDSAAGVSVEGKQRRGKLSDCGEKKKKGSPRGGAGVALGKGDGVGKNCQGKGEFTKTDKNRQLRVVG